MQGHSGMKARELRSLPHSTSKENIMTSISLPQRNRRSGAALHACHRYRTHGFGLCRSPAPHRRDRRSFGGSASDLRRDGGRHRRSGHAIWRRITPPPSSSGWSPARHPHRPLPVPGDPPARTVEGRFLRGHEPDPRIPEARVSTLLLEPEFRILRSRRSTRCQRPASISRAPSPKASMPMPITPA